MLCSKVNIRLMKFIDAAIGRIATSFIPAPANRKPVSCIASVLIIRPGGIGDAVLLASVICSLKKTYPAIHITILAEKRNVGVFPLIPGVDRLLCYDQICDLIKALRGSYDVVIDTEQWHRMSAVVSRITRAPVKIGFDTNERRRMFTHTIPYSHDDYEVVSFANLMCAVFTDLPDVVAYESFSLPETAILKAQSMIKSLSGVQRVVALFPGASIPEKRWPLQSWRTLAQHLAKNGMGVVVVGGKDVVGDADDIIRSLPGINTAGRLTLVETAAILKQSQLLVSGDSGVLHLAWLTGTPTVSLFGPSNAAKWAPCGDKHLVITRKLPCSPCSSFGNTPPCPISARCMSEISVDEVVEASLLQLRRTATLQTSGIAIQSV
jgi:ADP-heptose:LPS heptosyltransferase